MADPVYRHHITLRAAKAVVLYLLSQPRLFVSDDEIHRAQENDEKTMPWVIVHCHTATVTEAKRSGNWDVAIDVEVCSHGGQTTDEEHSNRVGEVFDLLMRHESATNITNALPEFTCFQLRERSQSDVLEDSRFKTTLGFEMNCCGSRIT